MSALVLEGGTFRPIFSCGVMDALLDNDIHFPYVIGVSAGIADGVSYVSRQRRRNYEIMMTYRNDKRYVGMRNFLKERSLFGLDFAYNQIPNRLIPFDWETYQSSPAQVLVGVTNARTGKTEYLDGKQIDRKCTMLQATCAIPLVFPPIELNGQEYYDGGICDPIPVRKAQKDGHERQLIVLTRPASYYKKLNKSNIAAARILKRRYPNLVRPLLTRHVLYNKTVAYCEQLEREGKAVLLRPSELGQIDSFEKDTKRLDRAYHHGYEEAVRRMEEIRALL